MNIEIQDFTLKGVPHYVTLSTESALHQWLMTFYAPQGQRCRNGSPGIWVCTRFEGHSGAHIGHNTKGVVGVWHNSDDPEEEDSEPKEREVIVEKYDPFGWSEESVD